MCRSTVGDRAGSRTRTVRGTDDDTEGRVHAGAGTDGGSTAAAGPRPAPFTDRPRPGRNRSGRGLRLRPPVRREDPLKRRRPAHRAPTRGDRPATFRQVFAVSEFRPLWGSYLLSTIGDELVRVALTILVYQRTGSPLLSATTFAISYLPWLVGGPVLATLADRLPRHRLLIGSDVIRAVLVAGMAVPGTPLPVLLALLLLVSVCAPPFEAARSALMADVLEGDRYAVATSLLGPTLQVSQLIAFPIGGALVTTVSPSAALLLGAATFAASALWLTRGLQRRPAPSLGAPGAETRSIWRDTGSGIAFIVRSPRLLTIVGLLWVVAMFANAPEGVATPLALQLQGTASSTGLLLAVAPAGTALGSLLVGRLCPPAVRDSLLRPLTVLSLAGMLLAGLVPLWLRPSTGSFVLVLVLLFLAGVGGAFTIPLNIAFVQAVPSAYRGRAFGVAAAGLSGAQGLGVVLAGLGAELLSPSTVVALAGGLGLLAITGPLMALVRTRTAAGHALRGRVAPGRVPEGRSGT
ncbi:MAG: Arabinose efflux permease [Modestobacter sp.]|nr:Arabinose efflux permease [Modestobacter sp.]